MNRQTDHSFRYWELDNTKIYKDGMTHQQYYLYNFGSNWKEESEWSINNHIHIPEFRDNYNECVMREPKERIYSLSNYDNIQNITSKLYYDEIKYGRWMLNIDYKMLDRFRYKHPIPDIFKHDVAVVDLIFCQKEELENPLTSLLREGMLEYYKFDMKMPIKLNYFNYQDRYVAKGWRRKDD